MKKKGFTLVELLGVVAILAVSLLVIIPSVTSILRKSEVNEYNDFTDDIYLATETYLNNNSDKYPELKISGTEIEITVKELKEDLLISKNLKNPKTDRLIEDTDSVTVNVTEEFEFIYKFNY